MRYRRRAPALPAGPGREVGDAEDRERRIECDRGGLGGRRRARSPRARGRGRREGRLREELQGVSQHRRRRGQDGAARWPARWRRRHARRRVVPEVHRGSQGDEGRREDAEGQAHRAAARGHRRLPRHAQDAGEVSPAGITPASGGERSLLANWLSATGAFLAALSFFAAAVLLVTNLLAPFRNPYMGIFLFVLAPAAVALGLLLVGLRASRDRRRRRRPGAVPLPRIDLNDPAQRRAAVVALVIAALLLFVTAVGSYQAYDYSESVAFCGQVCHGPMHPELTAYRDAPHARVGCVACHVGPGASWFVRSKITGVHQLYAVLAGTYPRPIPTPIDNLRPAQQTCEECHWPAKFYGDVERVWHHYLSDEQNSPWTIRLLLKVGGGDPTHGPIGGIHWHMNLAEKVEYIAADAGAGRGRHAAGHGLPRLPQPARTRLPRSRARGRDRDEHRAHRPPHSFRQEGGRRRAHGHLRHHRRGGGHDRHATHGLLRRSSRRLRGAAPPGDCRGDRRGAEHLPAQLLPRDAGGLEGLPEPHRPPHLAGLLPLPRRQPRERRREGDHARLRDVPPCARAGARRGTAAAAPPLPAPRRHRGRLGADELQRVPHRRPRLKMPQESSRSLR